MAPFPLIKLGYLAIRQISKPIANAIKRRAKTHPFFRKYICMPPAQFYHWCEVNIQLRLMGLGKTKNFQRMPDKDAIELGGEMLGEFIVFGMACLVVVAEYTRGARKEAAKEESLRQEKETINLKLEQLFSITEVQENQIRELQRCVDNLTLEKEKTSEKSNSTNSSLKKRLLG
ncbi:putative OPA3-like protein CG13603 [Biomphalaria glabrata]|uniref:OPA3-like protein CG13603 n=2 Tax=Biomphalaria TaxID=6525 RepID=A0A9W2ZXK7_BIOGL|nr:putative OPA3-like protein CG13603 [Biomphalaria glabrata]KAK0059833.1 OPA3-like protein [Biomphalaria pfeifferi]